MPADLTPIEAYADFGASIYRGREAPGNAVFDAVNALLDDEGQLFRRGGSVFKSNANAAATLVGLAELHTIGGQRTAFWTADRFYVLSADDATPFEAGAVYPGLAPIALSRPVVVGGVHIFRSTANGEYYYAGSRKPAYSTGTISVTAGSDTITGTGTAWLANVDVGMIFNDSSWHVVQVISNTQLKISRPHTLTASGLPYSLKPVGDPSGFGLDWVAFGAAGTVPRLLLATSNRVYFSEPGDPASATSDIYHELPVSARIIGLDAIGDAALVFTTAGVWAITNLDFDPIDGAGNIQHTVQELNELILWGEAGLARWRGAVVAPCVDDVWLVSLDAVPVPVAGGMKPLYLEYVKAGYQPGRATVHRGHYFLPIVNGTTLVDVLVCRLDRPYAIGRTGRGFPWTRWAGHGASIAYAQRIGATTRSPKLLGVKAQRVTELTDAFEPSAANKLEADSTSPDFDVITRDIDVAPDDSRRATHQVRECQLTYELVDAAADNPTLVGWVALGQEGAAFTGMTNGAGSARPESDGLRPETWRPEKMARRLRFRFVASGPSASLILRKLLVRVRTGR